MTVSPSMLCEAGRCYYQADVLFLQGTGAEIPLCSYHHLSILEDIEYALADDPNDEYCYEYCCEARYSGEPCDHNFVVQPELPPVCDGCTVWTCTHRR